MSGIKEKMTEIIRLHPADATCEEIMRELAFERMAARGLIDSKQGLILFNSEMEHQIRTWQK